MVQGEQAPKKQISVGYVTDEALRMLSIELDDKRSQEDRARAAALLDDVLTRIEPWSTSGDDGLVRQWMRLTRTVSLNRNGKRYREDKDNYLSELATKDPGLHGRILGPHDTTPGDPSVLWDKAPGYSPEEKWALGIDDPLVDSEVAGVSFGVGEKPWIWSDPTASVDLSKFERNTAVESKPAMLDDYSRWRNYEVHAQPLQRDESGRPYKVLSNGERVDIPDFREGRTVEFTLADGQKMQVPFDGEMQKRMLDAKDDTFLSNTILGGLASMVGYGPDRHPDAIWTNYGKRYVPKITGNPAIDRELYSRPEYQVAMETVSTDHGFLYHAGQAAVSGAEFVGLMLATKKAGGALMKSPLGQSFVEKSAASKMGLFTAKTVGTIAKAALEGGRPGGSLAAPGMHFDAVQLFEEYWYNTVSGVANGQWEPAQWAKQAAAETAGEYVLGHAARALRRGVGAVMASGALDSTLKFASQGKWADKRLASWASRYATEERPMIEAGAKALLGARKEIGDDALKAVEHGLFGEYGRMFRREAVAQVADVAFVGYMFGHWQAAQIKAAKDGYNWDELSWADKVGYFEPFDDPFNSVALGQAAGMISIQGGFLGATMRDGLWDSEALSSMGRRLSGDEAKETVDNLAQWILHKAHKFEKDGTLLRGVDAAFEGATTRDSMEAFVRQAVASIRGEESTLDLLAGDVGASMAKTSVKSLVDIYRTEKGEEILASVMRKMDDAELIAQSRRLRLTPDGKDTHGLSPSEILEATAIRDLVKEELIRRREGGEQELTEVSEEPESQGPKFSDDPEADVEEGGVEESDRTLPPPPPPSMDPATIDSHYVEEVVHKQADPTSSSTAPYTHWTMKGDDGKPEAIVAVDNTGAGLTLSLTYSDGSGGMVESPLVLDYSDANAAEMRRLGLVATERLAPSQGDLKALGMTGPEKLTEAELVDMGGARTRPGRILERLIAQERRLERLREKRDVEGSRRPLQNLSMDPRLGQPKAFRRLNKMLRGEDPKADPKMVADLLAAIRGNEDTARAYDAAKRRAALRALRDTLSEAEDDAKESAANMAWMAPAHRAYLEAQARGTDVQVELSGDVAMAELTTKGKGEVARAQRAERDAVIAERERLRANRDANRRIQRELKASRKAEAERRKLAREQKAAERAKNPPPVPPTMDDILVAKSVIELAMQHIPRFARIENPTDRFFAAVSARAMRDRAFLFGLAEKYEAEAAKYKAMFGVTGKPAKLDRTRRPKAEPKAEAAPAAEPAAPPAAAEAKVEAQVPAAEASKAEPPSPPGEPAVDFAAVLASSDSQLVQFGIDAFNPNSSDSGKALHGLMVAAMAIRDARLRGDPRSESREWALVAGAVLGGIGPGKFEGAGHADTVSAILRVSKERVEQVRQDLIRAGSVNDARILATLDSMRDSAGRKLLSDAQLKRGSTVDILRLLSLGADIPPRGRGRLFSGEGTLHGLKSWWKGSGQTGGASGRQQAIDMHLASGANPNGLAEAIDADWAGYIASVEAQLAKHPNGFYVKDLHTSLMGRIAVALGLGGHNVKLTTTVPTMDGKTIGRVTLELADAIAGKNVERTDPVPVMKRTETVIKERKPKKVKVVPGSESVKSDLGTVSASDPQAAINKLGRKGHVYRGMSEEEYRSTVGAGRGVESQSATSGEEEGTFFATRDHLDMAIGYGATEGGTLGDGSKRSKAFYLVEVRRTEGISPVGVGEMGEVASVFPVPHGDVTRVFRMESVGERKPGEYESFAVKEVEVPPAAKAEPMAELADAAAETPEVKPEEINNDHLHGLHILAVQASDRVRSYLDRWLGQGSKGREIAENSRGETVLLRKLANGDPETDVLMMQLIEARLIMSGEITDKTTADEANELIGGHLDEMHAAVDQLQEYAQKYFRASIAMMDPSLSGNATRLLDLVLKGIEYEARGESLPADLVESLRASGEGGMITNDGKRLRPDWEFRVAKVLQISSAVTAKKLGLPPVPWDEDVGPDGKNLTTLLFAGPDRRSVANAARMALALMNFSMGFRERLFMEDTPFKVLRDKFGEYSKLKDEEVYAPSRVSPKRILESMSRGDKYWQSGPGKLIAEKIAPSLLRVWQKHWIGYRSKRGLHTNSVRERNVTLSRIMNDASAEAHQMLFMLQQTLGQMKQLNFTSSEGELIGKLIESNGATRVRTKGEFHALLGRMGYKVDEASAGKIFSTMVDLHGLLVEQGSKMVSLGLIDPEAFAQLRNQYLPTQMMRWAFGPEGPVAYKQANPLASNYALASSEHERLHAESRLDAVRVYDVRYVMPIAVGKNARRIQLFRVLQRMAGEGLVISRDAYDAMGPLEKAQYTKASDKGLVRASDGSKVAILTEEEAASLTPSEQARVLSERAATTFEAAMLEGLISEEEKIRGQDGNPAMTPELADLFGTLRTGYITHNAAAELSLLIEQTDLSPNPSGVDKLSGAIQQMTLEWRQMRTVQNPKHWVLQFLSNWVTNSATGKVPMGDMLSSILLGEGVYADAAHELALWDNAIKSGAPKSDWSREALEVQEFVEMMGGNTIGHMMADPVRADDQIWAMFDSSRDSELSIEPAKDSDSAAVQMLSASMRATGRTRRGHSALAAKVAEFSGSAHPSMRAEATRSLLGVYNLHEMFWKYAAMKEGMRRGLSKRSAAEWGAEGSGDYTDRNPLLMRLTTNFSVGDSRSRKLANERLAHTQMRNVAGSMLRMGIQSPFWMYRASMLPTMARKQFTWKGISSLAAISLLIRAIGHGFGGDDEDLAEALADTQSLMGYGKDPEANAILRRRHGATRLPGFGGGGYPQEFSSTVGEWLDIMQAWAENSANTLTLGVIGSPRPEAKMLTMARGPTVGGQSTYFDMSDFAPVAAGITNIGSMMRGDVSSEGDVTRLGAGFLPGAAASALADMSRIWLLATGSGEKGKTRAQTAADVMLNLGAEWSAPMGGGLLGAGFSRETQAAVRTAVWDGASPSEIINGIPSATRSSGGIGELVSAAVTRATLPARKVSSFPVTDRPKDLSLFDMLGAKLPVPQSSDPETAAFERRRAQIRSTALNLLSQAYKQSLDERTRPYGALFAEAVDMRTDIFRTRDGTLDVVDEPQSKLGRWLRTRGNTPEERRPWVAETVESLSNRSTRLSRLLGGSMTSDLGLVYRKDVDPALHDRILRAAWDDSGDNTGLMRYMWSQMQQPDADTGVLSRIWMATGMERLRNRLRGDDLEAWRKATEWVKKNSYGVSGDVSPRDFRSAFGAAIYDLAPVQAVRGLEPKGSLELESQYPNLFGGKR